jgi:hypothetical protein
VSISRVQATLLGVLLASAACQSGIGADRPPVGSGVGGVGGGVGGRSGGAGDVRISILSPKTMQVITAGTSPEVRAQVLSVRQGSAEPSGDPVDTTSVQVSLHSLPPASVVVATGRLFGTANGEFAGPFDIAQASSGDYTLTVNASTIGGSVGMASIPVRIDAGPTIKIISPTEQGYKGQLTVTVVIDSAPFGPTMSVEARIGPVMIDLQPTGPNTYTANVEFIKMSPPLTGDQVLIVTATNAAKTMSMASVKFTIDNDGPILTATEPKEGAVVGGIIRVRAKVSDPFGVDSNSVVAFLGNRKAPEFKVKLKPELEPGVFSELFDTAQFTRCPTTPNGELCIVFPTLSFRASDAAGNESVVAYDIGVDNQPPVADLFPPPDMRIVRYSPQLKRLICSFAFDPLGDYRQIGDMPNDLCAVPQVFDLRARIEDAGNRALGLKHAPIAGVDATTTSLYVLGDTTQPLVVDVDGDGVCDAINPKLVPTTKGPTQSNEVLAIRLAPVPPKGAADFTPDPLLMLPDVRAAYPICSPGNDVTGPRRLCGGDPLSIVIGMPAARGPDPAIWSLEPITAGEPQCVGSQFDSYANEIPEGWACIAAAATDRLGNAGVSNPMRVWIQRQGLVQFGPGCPPPPPNAGSPPNCTGSYNRPTSTLTTNPCRGRAFPAREILNEGALPEGQ